MSELAMGGLLIGALVFLVLFGLHIAVALTAVGFAGIWLIREDVEMAMRLMYLSAYNGVADYIFATIPLFVLMGLLVSISNVGKDTFDVAETLLRRVRGGLGVATVAANTVFAAVTGFVCLACGHADNADVNAAKNILAAGHAAWLERAKACGEDVRRTKPARAKRAASVKQEPPEEPCRA